MRALFFHAAKESMSAIKHYDTAKHMHYRENVDDHWNSEGSEP